MDAGAFRSRTQPPAGKHRSVAFPRQPRDRRPTYSTTGTPQRAILDVLVKRPWPIRDAHPDLNDGPPARWKSRKGSHAQPPATPDDRAALRGKSARSGTFKERDDLVRLPRPDRRSCSSLPLALAGPAAPGSAARSTWPYIHIRGPRRHSSILQLLRFAIHEKNEINNDVGLTPAHRPAPPPPAGTSPGHLFKAIETLVGGHGFHRVRQTVRIRR